MLFDYAVYIVVDIGGHDYAILGAPVHCLGVYIIVVGIVLNQPAVLAEGLEILDSAVVDAFIVFVGACGKVDFRLNDMVERLWVSGRFGTGFVGVEHVVGSGGHLLHEISGRTDAAEGFDGSHRKFFDGLRYGWI